MNYLEASLRFCALKTRKVFPLEDQHRLARHGLSTMFLSP